jgi:hypothetical protein
MSALFRTDMLSSQHKETANLWLFRDFGENDELSLSRQCNPSSLLSFARLLQAKKSHRDRLRRVPLGKW